MASLSPAFTFPEAWTVADMHQHLGGIPLERIRVVPSPGTATERDVLQAKTRYGRVCELVDGVLVEKAMGYYESRVAAALIFFLELFLRDHDLGIVLAPDGVLAILPGQVRAADVAFLDWRHFPDRKLPAAQVPALAPDLAVEILSPSNTGAEMDRKLRDYFQAGVRLVWLIDAERRTAVVYRSPHNSTSLAPDQSLEGEDVLPGFSLPLADLFQKAGAREGA